MAAKILIYLYCYFSVVWTGLLPNFNCVSPPLKCPNENITFWLYTRKNPDNPHQLLAQDPATIKSAPWVRNAAVKILVHGYTGHKDFSPNTELRPAYLKCCDYNLITVDYNPIAREPCYIQAAQNSELVGMCTAQLVDELVLNHGFKILQIHPIGFSLGGQIVGYVGSYAKTGPFDRITALDPALPLFVTPLVDKKVDPSDAKFVDVLHTNALERGKLEPSGHVDFYANGGISQPGCVSDPNNYTKSSCDHARAPAYYAESINSEMGFYGTPCYFKISNMICEIVHSHEEIIFGEHVSYNSSGLYFFSTNSASPYAKGRSSD